MTEKGKSLAQHIRLVWVCNYQVKDMISSYPKVRFHPDHTVSKVQKKKGNITEKEQRKKKHHKQMFVGDFAQREKQRIRLSQ